MNSAYRPLPSLAPLVLTSALVATASVSCGPTFAPVSLITDERILAVRADPPEASPGEVVKLTAIIATPNGEVIFDETGVAGPLQVDWWRCPDADSDALADFNQCDLPNTIVDLGVGPTYDDAIPLDIFGAIPPLDSGDNADAGVENDAGIDTGNDAGVDTDAGTGDTVEFNPKLFGAMLGYWRVVSTSLENTETGHRVDAFKRIVVSPPLPLAQIDPRLGALDVRLEDDGSLHYNRNPVLSRVEIRQDSADGAPTATIKAEQQVFFKPIIDERVLEPYFSLRADLSGINVDDPDSLAALTPEDLLGRFEKVRRCEIPVFSWFVTAGEMRNEITVDERVVDTVYAPQLIACPAIEGDVRRPESVYRAPKADQIPDEGLLVHAWVVLRDGRGGVDTQHFSFTVTK